jgi:adenosylhomocysteinase
MKDGCMVANSGHFNAEINIPGLREISGSVKQRRQHVEEFDVNGKRVYLLADGRLINLSAAEGHPASVMDMSFANQALCSEYMTKNAKSLEKNVYAVPEDIDKNVAALKLKAMGTVIDTLTPEQEKYLNSWDEGTS